MFIKTYCLLPLVPKLQFGNVSSLRNSVPIMDASGGNRVPQNTDVPKLEFGNERNKRRILL